MFGSAKIMKTSFLGNPPETTLVEKAMTANPECATLDTSILDALRSMQDGKFLHIPVVDKNGQIIACLDALELTHATISMVEGTSGSNDVANSMMQKFWDSAPAMHPAEEFDARSDESRMVASDSADGKHIHPPHVNSSFCFKIEDKKGRMHRFSCVSESLDELVSAVAYRLGTDNDKPNIKLLVRGEFLSWKHKLLVQRHLGLQHDDTIYW